jgi:hypothetical protein
LRTLLRYLLVPQEPIIQLLAVDQSPWLRSWVVPVSDPIPVLVDDLAVLITSADGQMDLAVVLGLVVARAVAGGDVLLPLLVGRKPDVGVEQQVPEVLLFFKLGLTQGPAEPGVVFLIERVVPADSIHGVSGPLFHICVTEQPQAAVAHHEASQFELEAGVGVEGESGVALCLVIRVIVRDGFVPRSGACTSSRAKRSGRKSSGRR